MSKSVLASICLATASTMAFTGGTAAQNKVSALGLKDGFYCKVGGTGAIGDSVSVNAQDSPPYMGIDGLDCHDPVVRNSRLTAQTCYANGGIKLDVSKKFSAGDNRITLDGADYVLTPVVPGEIACGPKTKPSSANTAPKLRKIDTTGPGWSTWMHNGSTMLIDEKAGQIVYEEPKASIAGTIAKGTLLFDGYFEGKTVHGTAFVFKKGCDPAQYHVTGRMESNPKGFGSRIVLSGAAPRRDKNSCTIIGTTATHSRLVFEEHGDI